MRFLFSERDVAHYIFVVTLSLIHIPVNRCTPLHICSEIPHFSARANVSRFATNLWCKNYT